MKKLVVTYTLLIISVIGFSQAKHEIGPVLGIAYYMGELNQAKQFYQPKPVVGFLYRKSFNARWANKTQFTIGNLAGSDSLNPVTAGQERNLSFNTQLVELSSQIEFNYLPYVIGKKKTPFTPYLFCGLSAFYFNPRGTYADKQYDLRELGTEGQGVVPGAPRQYKEIAMAFLFGMGLKFHFSNRIGLNLEWSLRRTFTDYLDDVSGVYPDPQYYDDPNNNISLLISNKVKTEGADIYKMANRQRGNSNTKDWFSFATISLVFKIGDFEKCPGMSNKPFSRVL